MLRNIPVPFAVVIGGLFLGTVAFAQKKPDDKKPADDKAPVIKDIMKQSHTKEGPLNKVGQAVKGGRWDEAGPLAKQLVKAGDDLAKSTPPKKGSAASWAKMVKAYQADTKAVSDAVEKKNAAAFKEALDTLNSSCRDCHSVHK